MTFLRRETFKIVTTLLSIILFLFLFSCGGGTDSGKQKPATVDNPVVESALTTITLSPEAEQRLGIEIEPVVSRNMPGQLELGGEIIAPPGSDAKVSAPAAGVILSERNGKIVMAGARVVKGQEIMRLMLMPPEKELMGAREEVAVKQMEYEVAQAKMERAEQLIKDRAISEKVYQETRAAFTSASAALKAAKAKLNMFEGKGIESSANDLSTLVLEAPFDGVIQRLYVAPGQTVPGGTPLFDIASQNPVWVRIPVYAGDVDKIDLEKNARVQSLGNQNFSVIKEAKAVQGPPLSDLASASSDLFYQLNNENRKFRVGEKVSVRLILKSAKDNQVIPWSSLVYDIYGGTWVYVKTNTQVYARQRVEVSRILDGFAVVNRGLNEGDEVVTKGVAELYGTEFGGGK
jgi:cobalt-zinc-cadmium efflux system membrane fusion protein